MDSKTLYVSLELNVNPWQDLHSLRSYKGSLEVPSAFQGNIKYLRIITLFAGIYSRVRNVPVIVFLVVCFVSGIW